MKQGPPNSPLLYDQVNSNPSLRERELSKSSLYQQRLSLMFQMPPTQHLAEIHLRANKFGVKINFDPHRRIAVCPCCENPLHTEQASICTSTTPITEEGVILQSFELESSVCLYFTFIKFLTIYLLVLFLTVSIFALSMNSINELECKLDQIECRYFFLRFSPVKPNLQNFKGYLQVTDYLNLTMTVISIFLFQFYKKYQRKLHATLRSIQRSQQDFSVFVENIPKVIMQNSIVSFKYEQVLKDLLQTNYQLSLRNKLNRNSSVQSAFQAENRLNAEIRLSGTQQKAQTVKSICICINTSQLQKIASHRQEILQSMLQNGEMSASATTQARTFKLQDSKLNLVNQQFLQLSQELWGVRSYKWAISCFLGSAFVSFERESKRNAIIELYRQSPELFMIGDRQLQIGVAPMPEDVDWSGLNTEQKKSLNLQFYTFFFMLFLACFLVLEYLDNSKVQLRGRQISAFKLQTPISYNQSSFIQNLIIATVTYFGNFLIELLANYLASHQRETTKTAKSLSSLSKTIIAQSINTIGMYFLLSEISSQKNLLKNGVVNRVCYYLVFMGCLSVLFNLLQVTKFAKKAFNRLFLQNTLLDKGVQLHYNRSSQLNKFDFNSHLSAYILLLYTTMFFSFIAPICVPVIMGVFILNYWINKYHLFRNSSKFQPIDLQLFQRTLKFAEFSLVLFSLGNFYFSYLIEKEHRLINLIAVGLAGLYFITIILEQKFFQNLTCGQKTLFFDSVSYSECLKKGKFSKSYWLSNPATMLIDEPDLNAVNKKVDYNLNFRLADQIDLKRYQ